MAKPKDFTNSKAVQQFFSPRTEEDDVQVAPDTTNTDDTPNTDNTLNTGNTSNTHDKDVKVNKTRKQKHTRINMALYGSNHEYLEYISRLSGVSITQYVNDLIDRDRAVNQEKVDKAKEILKG